MVKVSNDISTVKQWYAIYTKYKCEKQVQKDVASKGMEAYVPLIQKVKRYTRKIKKYEVPLINCYVFVKILPTERVSVLETMNVLKFIQPSKRLVAIPEEEIDVLKRVVGDSESIISVSNTNLEQGDEVEIIAGNLSGMKGKLIKVENKTTVLIDLEATGYQIQITVDQKQIRKL